jgi:hypothetical protein
MKSTNEISMFTETYLEVVPLRSILLDLVIDEHS